MFTVLLQLKFLIVSQNLKGIWCYGGTTRQYCMCSHSTETVDIKIQCCLYCPTWGQIGMQSGLTPN